MSILTRDDILTADDLPRASVEVPEWGGTVIVRTMTGAERDRFEADVFKDGLARTEDNFRARLLARTICSEEGDRLFSESDIEALGRKSAQALDRLFPVAMRLSGLGRQAVEQAEKN